MVAHHIGAASCEQDTGQRSEAASAVSLKTENFLLPGTLRCSTSAAATASSKVQRLDTEKLSRQEARPVGRRTLWSLHLGTGRRPAETTARSLRTLRTPYLKLLQGSPLSGPIWYMIAFILSCSPSVAELNGATHVVGSLFRNAAENTLRIVSVKSRASSTSKAR